MIFANKRIGVNFLEIMMNRVFLTEEIEDGCFARRLRAGDDNQFNHLVELY